MGSPVVSGDIQPLSLSNSLCAEELQHLRLRDQMKEFLDWFIDETGDVSDAFLENIADKVTPIGTILLWSSATLPSPKYLLCNGQAISRTTYASLFARIGVVFGAGDSSTTFNLPNLTDRVPVGIGQQYTMGQQVGSKEVALTSAMLPLHSHTIPTRRVESVDIYDDEGSLVKLEVLQAFGNGSDSIVADGGIYSGNPASFNTFTTNSAGSAAPTNVSLLQPSLGVNFIIKVL
jgi:microcystin-dependent protein